MSALLRVEDVAVLLAVRPTLVRLLAHKGELPYVRVGRKLLRFRREDVESYIERSSISPLRGQKNRQ